MRKRAGGGGVKSGNGGGGPLGTAAPGDRRRAVVGASG
jgi:hypothetical protein